MTPEQTAKLFAAYTQADSSVSSKYGGTGLGLAISRHFCRIMGGDIEVKSELGRGTSFIVSLPRTISTPESASLIPQVEPSQEAAFDSTVLVIDDDATTVDILSRELSKNRVRVVGAASAKEGIEKARELRPAVITLDVFMQDMNGWDVLSELKADPLLAAIPVVMLTIADEKHKGFSLGAAEYLVKPTPRNELLAVVAKYVDQSRRTAAGSIGILLVDDDPINRGLMANMLREDQWKVSEAGNGYEALAAMQAGEPELIVLDLIMPEMDGITFLGELRKNAAFGHVPVVVITSKDLTNDERRLLNLNVDGVMQKGAYDLDALVRDVKRCALRPTSEEMANVQNTAGRR